MIGLKENSQKTDRKGTGIMKENRYELNKQLAQMLKGGVIMEKYIYSISSIHIKQNGDRCTGGIK